MPGPLRARSPRPDSKTFGASDDPPYSGHGRGAARMIAVCHNSGHCAWRPGPGTAHGTGRSRQQHRRRPSVCSVTCCGHVVDHALRSGEICLVIGVLPLKRSAYAAPTTLTARLRRRGRRPWPGPCRRGYLVRHVQNGSVEPCSLLAGSRASIERSVMRRREFVTVLASAAAWPLPLGAQQPGKLPTIGYLGPGTASSQSQWVAPSCSGCANSDGSRAAPSRSSIVGARHASIVSPSLQPSSFGSMSMSSSRKQPSRSLLQSRRQT